AAYETALRKAGLPTTDENVFIAASCGDKGIDFLLGKGKVAVRYREPKTEKPAAPDTMRVVVGGERFDVRLAGGKAIVNGTEYDVAFDAAGPAAPGAAAPAPAAAPNPAKPAAPTSAVSAAVSRIAASTPGTLTKLLVSEGDVVQTGQNLCVIEVMKMETFVRAARPAKITRVLVAAGDKVAEGQPLFEAADG
ncbi:MAG: biotin/lipoyl-binding protein, partial [Alphaproteobacteria bacterium]|nr:biotin/lipoyl-binding protein [Alphaproteobacteria bacterium]